MSLAKPRVTLAFIGLSLAAMFAVPMFAQPQVVRSTRTYYVDCGPAVSSNGSAPQLPLRSLREVNELRLLPGDALLFKRGSTCLGTLHPQGSGSEGGPIRIAAYGDGPLPRLEATAADDAVVQLFNQEFWEISSLDLSGGRTYGLFVGADTGVRHHVYLRNLRVHDVRGPLKHKESGLVVIKALNKQASFEDVQLDGILASSTTQWSGIFVAGATHVSILNSMVHDVQGDGIVVFASTNARIAHSVAWHTGMQHVQTIGTPNAIWTWRCTDCIVEDNEAFLTDSPGVDGGAFDIDFGNTRNIVRRNFGHDTAGYCVSVFGAFGPTTSSVVADNLCLCNGLSPKLAQRQGALLMMTWQGGSIDGLDIHGNRVDWQPPGDTPAIQRGTELQAQRVTIHDNEIWSTAPTFVNPALKFTGEGNKFKLTPAAVAPFGLALTRTPGWRLVGYIPSAMLRDGIDDRERAMLVSLKSAALQFGHAGLQVVLAGDDDGSRLAGDWELKEDGITFDTQSPVRGFRLQLISQRGRVVHDWHEDPGPAALGLALRQTVGLPVFGYLDIEKVPATD